MEVTEFNVRLVSSKKEIKDFMMDYCEKLHWMPCKLGEELCWVAGPDGKGFYVGELNGEKISGVSIIQHNDSYGFVGIYYCDEKHRGKGFALKTWKTAQAAIDPAVNLGLDAVVSAAHLYERIGFKRYWMSSYHNITVSSILDVYGKMEMPGNIRVKQATDVDFAKLKPYVEDVIGIKFARPLLLETWITLPSHKATVAVDDHDAIVGFAILRESNNLASDGYFLAPFLSENLDIARFLMLSCAKSVEPTQKIYTGSICDNTDATTMKNELQSDWCFDCVRMYTKGEVPIKKEKYFGIFSYMWIG